MKKLIVFLLLTLAAIAAKAEVVRIYAMDALTLQLDLTKPASDPAYFFAQIPVGTVVSTAGQYPWCIYRTLLRFDLSSIPDSAIVTDALIHMTVYGPPSTQEDQLQLAERMSFDTWNENAVDREGYVGSTVTQLGKATRLPSANNTVTWNLNTTSWDYASDIADNVLTMQVRYQLEGDYYFKGTNYYSLNTVWTENEWPYLELTVIPVCPSMDLTGDCDVDLEDLGVLAGQWLTVYDSGDFAVMSSEWLLKGASIPDITWVSVAETGFAGQMSQYETTNIQYCQFLNAAMASGDITVSDSKVYGASGSNGGIDYAGSAYYNLAGAYSSLAARIHYSGGRFTVDRGFENHPVNFVSRYGATAFCNYYGWRLPTLAQWQAVADFNGSYTYGCGTTINNTMANYNSSVGTTSAVGAYAAYGYGMCDMAGNVFEWTCTDNFNNSYICGGSWNSVANSCKISYLLFVARDTMAHNTGFRVCRDASIPGPDSR